MSLQILYMPQGTDEWHESRVGIITASNLTAVCAGGQGKTRKGYMYKLIGERMTGEPADSWPGNAHTERGHEHEPIACSLYESQEGVTVDHCGIMLNHGIGYSPDGMVEDSGLVEIKSRLPHLQAEVLDKDEVPTEHLKQIQGGLWVSEREWLDYISYWPGMPLFVKRVYRDESMIELIAESVEKFYIDLETTMNRIMEQSQ